MKYYTIVYYAKKIDIYKYHETLKYIYIYTMKYQP